MALGLESILSCCDKSALEVSANSAVTVTFLRTIQTYKLTVSYLLDVFNSTLGNVPTSDTVVSELNNSVLFDHAEVLTVVERMVLSFQLPIHNAPN
jgi:hypothetical protein